MNFDRAAYLEALAESGSLVVAAEAVGIRVQVVGHVLSRFRAGKASDSYYEKHGALLVDVELALSRYHAGRAAYYRAKLPANARPMGASADDTLPHVPAPENVPTGKAGARKRKRRASQAGVGRSNVFEDAENPYSEKFGKEIDAQVEAWEVGMPIPAGFIEVGGELVDTR